MRLFVFVSAFLLGTATLAAAQRPEFGGKAGPTFATLRFDPDDEELYCGRLRHLESRDHLHGRRALLSRRGAVSA
jgi:hypothetical protein